MTTQDTAPDEAGVVHVEGARLRYRIEGHGQPCLVVGSSIYYPRVLSSQQLQQHLRLVFVDLRHFAASSDPSFTADRISIDTYADDIERVRQTLGLGDVVVIGHSIHGLVALEYARRYPEHVRGVAAVGANTPGDPDERDRLWATEASEDRKEILDRQLAELTPELRATLTPAEFFVRQYVARGPTMWFDPSYDCSWLWEGVVLNQPIADRLFDDLFPTYDLAQGPGEIGVAVFIACGRYDYSQPFTIWEEHLHELPRHTYALFERSGHHPPLEEPERFDETLLAWINGLGD